MRAARRRADGGLARRARGAPTTRTSPSRSCWHPARSGRTWPRSTASAARPTTSATRAPGGPADRLEALDAWEAGLLAAVEGRDARGALAAAADVICRRGLPLDPFLRLIEANRMDQRRARWDTHAELLEYCRHSATPVGEMVLGVLGYRDAWRIGLSDATCAGLQLVNFWQDIARDLRDRDRIYLPRGGDGALRRRARTTCGSRSRRPRCGRWWPSRWASRATC